MSSLTAFAILAFFPGQGPKIDADHFLNLVRTSHGNVHDVAFVFEGQKKIVAKSTSKEDQDFGLHNYQGTYLYRIDGATRQDIYIWRPGVPLFLRSKGAILGNTFEQSVTEPDVKMRAVVTKGPKSPYALNPIAPRDIFFHWYFQWITDPRSLGYEFLGWESIQGHNCLKVRIGLSPTTIDSKTAASCFVFWIDLERGGNPLQAELYLTPPSLISRSHSIVLEKFVLKGQPEPAAGEAVVWLPTSGVVDSFFVGGTEYSDAPVWTKTYFMVQSSLQLNTPLKDADFSIKKDYISSGTPTLALRKQYEEAVAKQKPLPRTDPASVSAMLNKNLAEADRQSKMLEAS